MEVDMRSEDAASLAAIDVKVQKALRDALAAENARWTGPRAASAKLSLVVDTMGIRPTGGQADAAPIVQTALSAAKALGFTSATGASSTDANLPISLGIPAIRMAGGGTGDGAHSLGECVRRRAERLARPAVGGARRRRARGCAMSRTHLPDARRTSSRADARGTASADGTAIVDDVPSSSATRFCAS